MQFTHQKKRQINCPKQYFGAVRFLLPHIFRFALSRKGDGFFSVFGLHNGVDIKIVNIYKKREGFQFLLEFWVLLQYIICEQNLIGLDCCPRGQVVFFVRIFP